LDFLKLITDAEGQLAIQREDEIVAACLMCSDGNLLRSA
jgi:NAD(P) transhydrogenase subunit alpha